MAGEKGVLAAGGPEQSPTDAAEGEGAGGGRVRGGGVVERALELGDALAEGGVGEIQEPADFLAGMAGEGEERGEAEGWGEVGGGLSQPVTPLMEPIFQIMCLDAVESSVVRCTRHVIDFPASQPENSQGDRHLIRNWKIAT